MYGIWQSHLNVVPVIYSLFAFATLNMDSNGFEIAASDFVGYHEQRSETPLVRLEVQQLELQADTKHILPLKCSHGKDGASPMQGKKLYIFLYTNCAQKVTPYVPPQQKVTTLSTEVDSSKIAFRCNQSLLIGIYAQTVGRCRLTIKVAQSRMFDLPGQVFQKLVVDVAVLRKVRIHDLAFEVIMAVISLLVSFSIGCSSDLTLVSSFFHTPFPVVLSFFYQYLFVPLVSAFSTFCPL